MPYPTDLADAIRDELRLDGTGRLLDIGCGPGSLTLLLAPLFEAAVGVDADADMLVEADHRARTAKVTNVEWRRLRAEELPADLGGFRVVTFAQSFHWMDQQLVAQRVRSMLEPGGRWVHVAASTYQGVSGEDVLRHPRPPWSRIDHLVAEYLGPVRRAGRGSLPTGTRAGEEEVMRRVGFTGPVRREVGGGVIVDRDIDELISAGFSLSGSAPHHFGRRAARIGGGLRASAPG